MGEPRSWGEFMEALTELVGQADDTGGSQTAGTVMAKGNAILEVLKNGGMPVVKSVQFGYVKAARYSNVVISKVDPGKSLINITGNSSSGDDDFLSITEFHATGFTISNYKTNVNVTIGFSWQVIEFY